MVGNSMKKEFKIGTLLLTTILTSCSYNGDGDYRIYRNEYKSYNEMILHLEELNKNFKEESNTFDVQVDGFKTSYYIAGIDHCVKLNKINSFEEHKDKCDYLETREIYYYLTKDDFVFTLTFNIKNKDDIKNASWTNEKAPGKECQYNTNEKGATRYYSDKNNNYLVLKSNKNDYEDNFISIIESINNIIKRI